MQFLLLWRYILSCDKLGGTSAMSSHKSPHQRPASNELQDHMVLNFQPQHLSFKAFRHIWMFW